METIIIKSSDIEKTNLIKEYLIKLKVKFESKRDVKETDFYDMKFVNKILERSENAKNGNIIPYTNELKKELFGK